MAKKTKIVLIFSFFLFYIGVSIASSKVEIEGNSVTVMHDKKVVLDRKFACRVVFNIYKKGCLCIGLEDGKFYIFNLNDNGSRVFQYDFEGNEVHVLRGDDRFLYVDTIEKISGKNRLYVFDMVNDEELVFNQSFDKDVVHFHCTCIDQELFFCIGLEGNIFYMMDGDGEVLFDHTFDDDVCYARLDGPYLHVGLKNGKMSVFDGSNGDKVVFNHQFDHKVCLSHYNKDLIIQGLCSNQLYVLMPNARYGKEGVYVLLFKGIIKEIALAGNLLRVYVGDEEDPYAFDLKNALKQVFEDGDNKKSVYTTHVETREDYHDHIEHLVQEYKKEDGVLLPEGRQIVKLRDRVIYKPIFL